VISDRAAATVTTPALREPGEPAAETEELPPMHPTKMKGAVVIPFPLVRRKRLIARLRRSKPGEFRHYVDQQVSMLRRAGIAEDEIDRQLRALFCAVQFGMPNCSHTPGGAA
jgi:hypothetical protein